MTVLGSCNQGEQYFRQSCTSVGVTMNVTRYPVHKTPKVQLETAGKDGKL